MEGEVVGLRCAGSLVGKFDRSRRAFSRGGVWVGGEERETMGRHRGDISRSGTMDAVAEDLLSTLRLTDVLWPSGIVEQL